VTFAFLPAREETTSLSKGFAFLTVVVVSAAVGRLGPGILASLLGFLAFNYFHLPPYHTFVLAHAEDLIILLVFLGLSILISALIARAAERAEAAEAREEELRILQTLSAELVAAVPGPETYRSILSHLLEVFGFSAASLWVPDPQSRELREQATAGVAPGTLTPGGGGGAGPHPPERLALSVGGRVLALLLLRRDGPPLTPAESRVMRAFCDQFALVLERDRLLRGAAEAESLRRTEDVRRSLLAAVSHDLRSPLAAIKASVTDLLAGDTTHAAAPAREALESINRETDRLSSMIANLLDMSRIEGGMLKPRLQAVDLAEVVATSVDRARLQWPGLQVHVAIREDASMVRADPVFLDRVLANLLDNAARASVETGFGTVEVEARPAGGAVSVRIIDHGRGVPREAREQLFYPFYQVDRRHPRLGTGLGLAIAKGFLALMGGEIWIEDTPGGGATFALSLSSNGGR
jgi:two-component system sensor histidine kinase KdpD